MFRHYVMLAIVMRLFRGIFSAPVLRMASVVLASIPFLAGAESMLLNDFFTDGNWTGGSGGGEAGASWFTSNPGSLSVVDDSAGIGSGLALRFSGTTAAQKVLAHFHPVTLTAPGDWLRLSLNFRFENSPPPGVWAGLRAGFYNSRLTRTTGDGTTTLRNDDYGCGGFLTTASSGGANSGVFLESAGDEILGGSTGPVGIGTPGFAPANGIMPHTLVLLLSRQANGDLAITMQIDSLGPASGIITNAPSPAFTLDCVAVGEGAMTVPLVVDNVVVTSSQQDDFERLRKKWLDIMTGGTNYNLSDPQVQSKLASIANSANSYWNSMEKSPGRTYLWSTLTSTTSSSQISSMGTRFRAMALAYASYGCSLYGNSALAADLVSAMDWYYTNRYNETKTVYDNWWDWEIGAPMNLEDAYVMVYDRLTPVQLGNFTRATARFTPVPAYTGANLAWKARVVGIRAAMNKNFAELRDTRDSMSQLFPYVTSGDGFYADGSFIQHNRHPYTAGYGLQLIANTAPLLAWLDNSAGEVTDPARTNVMNWVFNAYAPIVYRGAAMDMVRGREISRAGSTDHSIGLYLMDCIFRLSQIAAPEQSAQMKSLVKYWASVDSTVNYNTHGSLNIYTDFRQMLLDPGIPVAPEPVFHKQFWGMDRVVHARPGWGLGLSCSSARIYNFESCCGGENLHAWFTADGMTFLYNSDLTQFTDGFWPTVDPYRLPGTTVDTTTRVNGGGNYLSPARWVGGAVLSGEYGVAGMQLQAAASTLTGRKSWFMFDNEVVCLGAGISCVGANPVQTTVENRRLNSSSNNALIVNGQAMPSMLGWSSNLTGVSWCALNSAGGCYFPTPANLSALRQSRTGSWRDINDGGSATSITRNYLALWLDHGVKPANATYEYVLLPNFASSAVSQYAGNADILVLTNSATVQAVKEKTLGIVAANFWVDGSQSVDFIGVNKQASVIARQTATTLEIGVADPTQTNSGSILVTLNRHATNVLSSGPGVTVLQLVPQIQLSVNVNGARGQTRRAVLELAPPLRATDDSASTAPGTPVLIDVLANDIGEGPMSIYSVSQPLHGAAYVTQGLLAYVPAAGFAGTDQLQYVCGDGVGQSAGTVSIAVSTLPTFSSSQVSASSHDGNVPSNAVDGNLETRWSASGDGQWIELDLLSPQRVDAVSIAFYQGDTRVAAFDIRLSIDGIDWVQAYEGQSGGLANGLERFDFPDRWTRFVRVTGHGNSQNLWNSYTEIQAHLASNQAPVAVADQVSVRAGEPSLINPVANDFDPDDGPRPFWLSAVTAAAHGSAAVTNNQVRYLPSPGFSGADSFSYVIVDSGLSATGTVLVTVTNPPSLPPELSPIADRILAAGSLLLLTNQASDPNVPAQELIYSLLEAPAGAQIDPASGVVTWLSSSADTGSSNRFTVAVRQKGGWETALAPVADAHAVEGFPNANYGLQTHLVVKLGQSPGLSRETFLKFDLAEVPGEVLQASLRLFPTLASAPGTHVLALVAGDQWQEAALTWANKPGSTETLAAWNPQEGQAVSLPITEAVRSAMWEDRLLSLRVHGTNTTADGLVHYVSREGDTAKAPLLCIGSVGPSLSASQSFWVSVVEPVQPLLSVAGMDTAGRLWITLTGQAGPDYTLQASTNFLDWISLVTTSCAEGICAFVDPDATNHPRRFYRVEQSAALPTSEKAGMLIFQENERQTR